LEPAVSASSSAEGRAAFSRRMAEDFDKKCGKIWESYRACVQNAVKAKGLDQLLQQAREENPLVDPSPPQSK